MSERRRPSPSSSAVGLGRVPAAAGRERVSQAYDGAVRDQLADIQRTRIVRAMCDIAAERGALSVTVADVVERAGVSRRTFYELFSDRDNCFLAAFEQGLAHASEQVIPAYQEQRAWLERIRAGLVALLGFLDEEPVIARVLIVEAAAAGSAVLARRNEVIERLTGAVDEGAREGKTSASSLTGEGVVGGVLSVLHSRVIQGHDKPLTELTGPLMSMIVLPYMGAAAARRESERPAPKPARSGRPQQLVADPFKDTGLRLTYRTVRVLTAIADLAGRGINPSNRLIADIAEIKDQGQISKLLTRLDRAGLITNENGLIAGQGAPNSWTLTDSGLRVLTTIGAHAEGSSRTRSRVR